MAITESEIVRVAPPKMGLYEQLYLPAIFDGLRTTVKHMVGSITGGGLVTQSYPEQQPDLPANYRGVHRLNRDEHGRVRCVACYMCSTACPAHCIDIVAAPAPKEWQKDGREKYPEVFVIDELRCIYCGMCEQACPVDAIELTTIFDITGLTREELVFDKEKLLSVFDQTKDTPKNPVRTKGGRLGVASELADAGPTVSSTASQS